MKSLTQSNNNDDLYQNYITDEPTDNNKYGNINTMNLESNQFEKEKIQKENKLPNKVTNQNNNYSKILRMYDEEKKKSMELQSEINSLKAQINTKVKENQNLNNKISLLENQLEEINQENSILFENNDIFYQNFLAIITDFKEQNLFNVQLPNYSMEDEQGKRYEDIIYTFDVLINILQDLTDNTNDNIIKYNELRNKINLANKKYAENAKEKNNEVTILKKQLFKMKKILEQNMAFLDELREENNVLKQRNLNLEKNINLISKSNEGFRRNNFVSNRIYSNNKNNYLTRNNISNISMNTNKTTTDLLIEEFQNKENKMNSLHNMAQKIFNNVKKGKIISKSAKKFDKKNLMNNSAFNTFEEKKLNYGPKEFGFNNNYIENGILNYDENENELFEDYNNNLNFNE